MSLFLRIGFPKLSKPTMPNDADLERMRQETAEACLKILDEPEKWRGDYAALARVTLVGSLCAMHYGSEKSGSET